MMRAVWASAVLALQCLTTQTRHSHHHNHYTTITLISFLSITTTAGLLLRLHLEPRQVPQASSSPAAAAAVRHMPFSKAEPGTGFWNTRRRLLLLLSVGMNLRAMAFAWRAAGGVGKQHARPARIAEPWRGTAAWPVRSSSSSSRSRNSVATSSSSSSEISAGGNEEAEASTAVDEEEEGGEETTPSSRGGIK